jgi:hypothetical protein
MTDKPMMSDPYGEDPNVVVGKQPGFPLPPDIAAEWADIDAGWLAKFDHFVYVDPALQALYTNDPHKYVEYRIVLLPEVVEWLDEQTPTWGIADYAHVDYEWFGVILAFTTLADAVKFKLRWFGSAS